MATSMASLSLPSKAVTKSDRAWNMNKKSGNFSLIASNLVMFFTLITRLFVTLLHQKL